MNEIICPHCKKAFKIDEAGFADILKQVRDHTFEKELHDRITLLERDKESAVKLAEEKTKNELQTESAKKDAEIAKLVAKLDSAETEKELALTQAINKIEKERDELASKLQNKDIENKLLESSLKDKHANERKTKHEMIDYKKDMKATGTAARGWVWTAWNQSEERLFNYLADAQNAFPIWGATPIVALDTYEHAYFIDFGAARGGYIDAFFENVDWNVVSKWFTNTHK